MNRRHTAYLYLLVVSIIWGAAGPIVKHTLTWFDPWLFLTYRFLISTAIALPFLKITNTKIPSKQHAVWLLMTTSVISAPLTLYLYFDALDKTTALSGSLISAIGPMLMVLGGMLFFKDRVTKNEKLGIGIALLGTILTVLGPLLFNGQSDTLGKLNGNTIMVIAVLTDIIGALLSKEAIKKGISTTLLSQFPFVIGFFLFVPILLFRQSPDDIGFKLLSAPWQAHAGVLYMAILSGTIAYSMRNIAIKTIEVSESAIFNYLQPLWGAILAVLWLKEPITISYIVGGLVIALGVFVGERRR
jgi:drug/metabolite transporter (DMT)-like permease